MTTINLKIKLRFALIKHIYMHTNTRIKSKTAKISSHIHITHQETLDPPLSTIFNQTEMSTNNLMLKFGRTHQLSFLDT